MKFTITENEADQRFDRFLRKYFKPQKEIKLTDIFARIRKGAIKINGRKRPEKRRLQEKDIVSRDNKIETERLADNFKRTKSAKIKDYPLEEIQKIILYEDDNRLVFNKPADLVMHPGTGHIEDMSLHDIMKTYLKQTTINNKNTETSTFNPSFCFRLDRDTSGIVIAAKNYQALQYLNKEIKERKTDKTYLAVVSGIFPKEKTINTPLFKGFDKRTGRAKVFVNHEQGKSAKTSANLVKQIKHSSLGNISLVEVQIYTGRMHQIRVHLSSIGYPIIGDVMYGIPAINRIASKKEKITRQLLHSLKYGFLNTFTDTYIEFITKKPSIFQTLFDS